MKRFNDFDYVGKFYSNNLAPAAKGDKWGFINPKGEVVIPLIYDWAYTFYEGISVVEQKGLCAFIDEDGKLLTDFIYTEAIPNSLGIRALRKGKKITLLRTVSGDLVEVNKKP